MNLSEERGVQNVQKALECLEHAVALDPNYAVAWAGIAHLHRDIVGQTDSENREHYERSMEAIRKALAIDPNISDAYSALCQNRNRYEYDAVGAEAACKRALELDPNSPQAHKTYTNFLYSRGRFDEAIEHIKTAMELQPVSYRNQQVYGLALLYAKRYPEAEAQFRRLLELNPTHHYIHGQLALILELQGRQAEAFDYLIQKLILKKAENKADDKTIEHFKAAYVKGGWQAVTRKRIKNQQAETIPGSFSLACLYARLADKDKAFEYLEKAFQERSFLIAVIKVAPQLDPLRDDPRYTDLINRIERH
jgi:tetratricopeptide (TPR) repeat protein